MQIRTIEGSVIATIEGTFENAYEVAMHFWAIAGAEGVHMDGLHIVDEADNTVLLKINYGTHER